MMPVDGTVWFTLSKPAVVTVRIRPTIAMAIIAPLEIFRIVIFVCSSGLPNSVS